MGKDDMSKWLLVAAIVFAVACLIYAGDQQQKRLQEQAAYRRELARKEAQLKDLEVRLGRQSAQVKALAAEVEYMRKALAA